jgi:hypothetical protein
MDAFFRHAVTEMYDEVRTDVGWLSRRPPSPKEGVARGRLDGA